MNGAEQAATQQDGSGFSASFNTGSFDAGKTDWSNVGATKSFIPKGKYVKTDDDFPDLGADLDDVAPKTKKEKRKAPVQQP